MQFERALLNEIPSRRGWKEIKTTLVLLLTPNETTIVETDDPGRNQTKRGWSMLSSIGFWTT
jgi:hypothetical protein